MVFICCDCIKKEIFENNIPMMIGVLGKITCEICGKKIEVKNAKNESNIRWIEKIDFDKAQKLGVKISPAFYCFESKIQKI